jgi:hypothetical protein
MAEPTRYTWATMKAEHILRMGREADTNYASRAEHFISAAYLWIAKKWHFLELDSENTSLVFSTSNNEVDIASISPCIVYGVELRAVSDSAFIKMLVYQHSRRIFDTYQATAGEPVYYTQFGEKLYCDRLPDQAYKSRIFFYSSEPTKPDFGSGGSELGESWDEAILQYSLYLAATALSRPDLAAGHYMVFQEQVNRAPEPMIADEPQRPEPSRPLTDRSHAGGSG